jgi:hypothetical protein
MDVISVASYFGGVVAMVGTGAWCVMVFAGAIGGADCRFDINAIFFRRMVNRLRMLATTANSQLGNYHNELDS